MRLLCVAVTLVPELDEFTFQVWIVSGVRLHSWTAHLVVTPTPSFVTTLQMLVSYAKVRSRDEGGERREEGGGGVNSPRACLFFNFMYT